MPWINGRYYMNPFQGRALEKARVAREGGVWTEEYPESVQQRPIRKPIQEIDFWDDDGKSVSGARQSLGDGDFWDDPPSGQTQQQEDGHWVTIDHRHVLIREAQARQALASAQDTAMHDYPPQGEPGKPGRKTFCNEATCSVAKATGAPMRPLINTNGVPLKADQIGTNLAKPGSGYRQVSANQAQQLADQGKLVIVAGPGHVATVRTDTGQVLMGHGPIIANVGKANGVKRLSYVFTQRAMPEVKFYTPSQ